MLWWGTPCHSPPQLFAQAWWMFVYTQGSPLCQPLFIWELMASEGTQTGAEESPLPGYFDIARFTAVRQHLTATDIFCHVMTFSLRKYFKFSNSSRTFLLGVRRNVVFCCGYYRSCLMTHWEWQELSLLGRLASLCLPPQHTLYRVTK